MIKKDEEVLGFSTKESDDDERPIKDYHKDCWNKLKKEGYLGTIEGMIREKLLKRNQ